MTVAQLRALLLQYPEYLRVLIEDHDGWLDPRGPLLHEVRLQCLRRRVRHPQRRHDARTQETTTMTVCQLCAHPEPNHSPHGCTAVTGSGIDGSREECACPSFEADQCVTCEGECL